MFKLNVMNIYIFNSKIIFYVPILLIIIFIISAKKTYSNQIEPKVSINGSGLEIPRMVSLKKSTTYMRSGPGKEFPVKFEFKKKDIP